MEYLNLSKLQRMYPIHLSEEYRMLFRPAINVDLSSGVYANMKIEWLDGKDTEHPEETFKLRWNY